MSTRYLARAPIAPSRSGAALRTCTEAAFTAVVNSRPDRQIAAHARRLEAHRAAARCWARRSAIVGAIGPIGVEASSTDDRPRWRAKTGCYVESSQPRVEQRRPDRWWFQA